MGELRNLMIQKLNAQKVEINTNIIQLCKEGKSHSEIAKIIAQTYGVRESYAKRVIAEITQSGEVVPAKKEKNVIKNDMAAYIIRDMTEAIRKKQYKKAYHLANGDLDGVEQHNRREIAKLKRLAMNSIIIEEAKKQGKDAAELAASLGIRVKEAVDIMGVKVEKPDGTIEYKERTNFDEER